MRFLLLASFILIFLAAPARADTISVCHAHGCAQRSPVTFNSSDVAALKRIMVAHSDRAGISKAISWMEKKSGREIGITDSLAALPPLIRLFSASGLHSQQDCLDEATNTEAYLKLLVAHGILKGYKVLGLVNVGSSWPHWVASIQDPEGGVWRVDSDVGRNGTEPNITRRHR